MVYTFGNNIVSAYTGGVPVVTIYSFGVKVWPILENNKIFYTSTSGNIIVPSPEFGDVNIVSNTYDNGVGVILFDGPVTEIGAAFPNTDLSSIVIPQSVMYLGGNSFINTDLTSLYIPSNIMQIYNSPLIGGSDVGTISVDLYNNKYDSRNNCNAIIRNDIPGRTILLVGCKNTIIPDTVNEIMTNAFFGCIGLTTIIIPSSITNIGDDAFYSCSNLTQVIVNCTVPPTLGSGSFDNCSPNLLIKVPAASLNAYLTAPGWSTYANKIVGYSDTDEIDFTTLGLENTQVVDVDTYGPFSSGDMEVQFTTTNQTYTSKYYTNGTAVRVYRENSVVISSSKTISRIEFTWTGSYMPSSDVATPSGYDYQTHIWTGSANQVTLTRPNESSHWRLKSILVTYL